MIAQEGLEQGVITQEEAELLREAEQHRLDTINVDDFEPELLAAKPLYPQMENVAWSNDGLNDK